MYRGALARVLLAGSLAVLIPLSGCASVGPQTCSLVVVESASGAPGAPGEGGLSGRVESDCQLVSSEALVRALPKDRRTVERAAREAFKEATIAAAAAFYDDSAGGLRALEESLAQAQENPGLLPTEPAARQQVYQALGVLLLARYDESQQAGDELASWLATHLPDQVPSVQQLPPKLSVRAAEALSHSQRDKGTLSVGPSPDCEEASLLLDGRPMGTLPLRDLPVHRGRHAVWFECGEVSSWTRLLEITSAASLAGPVIAHEALFDLGAGHLRLHSAAPGMAVAEPVRRLLPALGVDVVALMPADSGGDALLVTADRALVMPLATGPVALSVRRQDLWPRPWTSVAKWVAVGITGAALGAGMTAHALHDREVEAMRYGTIDNRAAADTWQIAAVGGYATAATAAAGAALLFFLDASHGPLPEPLFSTGMDP